MENINAISRQSEQLEKIRDALTLLNYPGKRNIREMRKRILGLEAAMQAMPGQMTIEDFNMKHHFAPGLYLREGFLPRGTVLTGKIHKTEHYCILSQGEVSVMTEDGIKTLHAPSVIHSMPGMKRVLYALQDSTWINVHHNPTNERDLEKIDEIYTVKSFEELEGYNEGLLEREK